MSRPVRIAATVVVLAVVFAAVAGIAFWTVNHDPNAPNPGLFVDGKKVEDPPAMLKFGEHEVPFSVYRHYYLLYSSYFESYYGETFYDDDPDGDKLHVLKQSLLAELEAMYAWIDIANEMGVVLDDADRAEINETLDEQKTTYGDAFAEQLIDLYYLDEQNYIQVAELQRLAEKAEEAYRESVQAEKEVIVGDEADQEFEENYITAKHILIKPNENAPDAETARADALIMAEQIRAEIVASEDVEAIFDERMHAYSADVDGLEANPDGYTFTEDEMVDVFYEAALALDEYEVSEPVWSETEGYSGYHIILRLPLNKDAKQTNRESAVSQAVNEAITTRETEAIEALEVTYGEYYGFMTHSDIR